MRTASVYVHFPWCLAKCPYCDFVSYATFGATRSGELIDSVMYADAVIRELGARAPLFSNESIESIFFGGGTPSLWAPEELGRVIRAVRETLACASELEVTVECNPTSFDEEKARALVDVGVNRVSIGVQSLRQAELTFLGRLHDARGALRALEAAQRACVPRVSADLIFGLPNQRVKDACDQALELADVGLSHLSCYQLTIEPGTRFGELAKRGRLPLADDGAVADAFVAIDEVLSARGYAHYEISNYAKAGDEARHNLAYWRGDAYLGLGCGAFGFAWSADGKSGSRYRNWIDPQKYLESSLGSDAALQPRGFTMEEEALSGEALLRERIMLGLRVASGIDLDGAARELGCDGWTEERTIAAEKLEARGRIRREGGRIKIPESAWLWSDDTAARLF